MDFFTVAFPILVPKSPIGVSRNTLSRHHNKFIGVIATPSQPQNRTVQELYLPYGPYSKLKLEAIDKKPHGQYYQYQAEDRNLTEVKFPIRE